jgi:hypothetical protein
MPEAVANTSPIQYLFQLGMLDCLPQLYGVVRTIERIAPYLARLEALGFRLAASTRADVLELAGELAGG